MATIKSVERSIRQLEGFDVRFRHEHDGRDVRSDRRNLPGFGYERRAKDDFSVSEWKRQRFGRKYPSFAVDVLNYDGSVAHGAKKLENVRKTYD